VEKKFPGNSYIEKIAEILMKEGDIETSKRLQKQIETQPSRDMTEEEAELYEIKKTKARKFIELGDFERAVDSQRVALELIQRAFGPEHIGTLKDMCELGEHHFRNGEYKEAKNLYDRSLQISITKFGELHPFSNRVKKNIRKCVDAVRRANGVSNLEQHINNVFRMNAAAEPHENDARIDRLETIGDQLVTRGKMSLALKIYKSLISLTLEKVYLEDEKSIQNIKKYADFLAAYGNLAEAETTYKSVVRVRNRQNQLGERAAELKSAISDWAHCLALMGHSRSAKNIQELANKISPN
jgi:tetratricopeptide (TPR) repeat protein